ncbi:MAG: HAMP domain-containing histidine kinase [Dactylosporangium sp.]|nr:HAMP domain-containing histidine kinase [Dactylosporangium sp.]
MAYGSVAATSIVALAFLIPLGLVVQQLVEERALADAERQAVAIAAVLTVTTDPASVERALETVGPSANTRVSVHNLSAPVGQRRASPDEISLVAAQAATGKIRPVVVPVTGGQSYLEPIDIGSWRFVVVEVYVPNSELHRGVRGAWLALSIVAAGLVITSVVVSDRLAAKVVRSARQLAGATRSLGEGHLDVRVAPSGPRELADAGVSFNVMADRIVALLANERELIADLSHRLRTPLTALRLDAETLNDTHAGQRIQEAIAALEAEVDQIIRVARQQSVTIEPTEPTGCDASEVVSERMSFWSAVAGDQGRECRVLGGDQPAPVTVPRSELAAALDALLGNVIRYTPQGVPFEVAVSRRKDGYIVLRIDDAGPGIPDPERALRRGTSGKGSTGLGLDIVRRVSVSGRGAVNVGRGRLGGASVVILLADAERPPSTGSRFGLVGRLSREPGEQRRSGLIRRS